MADDLTDKQRRAIVALLTERTVQDAAARVGIGERTLRRCLDDADFRAAVTEASRQRLAETVGRLRAVACDAVEALHAALSDDSTANRIRAATVLLYAAVRVEVDDLGQRVAAMESVVRPP
jgi:hypothetical protein